MKKSSKTSRPLKLTPIADRVAISAPPEQANPNKEQMVDGIIIPEIGQTGRVMDPYYVATVEAVGDACKLVKVGMRVVVDRPHIFQVEVGKEIKQCMIREPNIVAIAR